MNGSICAPINMLRHVRSHDPGHVEAISLNSLIKNHLYLSSRHELQYYQDGIFKLSSHPIVQRGRESRAEQVSRGCRRARVGPKLALRASKSARFARKSRTRLGNRHETCEVVNMTCVITAVSPIHLFSASLKLSRYQSQDIRT